MADHIPFHPIAAAAPTAPAGVSRRQFLVRSALTSAGIMLGVAMGPARPGSALAAELHRHRRGWYAHGASAADPVVRCVKRLDPKRNGFYGWSAAEQTADNKCNAQRTVHRSSSGV